MYNDSLEQVKGSKTIEAPVVRLAQVKSVVSGRARIQFAGESSVSEKDYPYVVGYNPKIDDYVLVLNQGMTYIIVGKYLTTAPGNSYYLSKEELNGMFMTEAEADAKYMPIGTTIDTNKLKSGSYTVTLQSDGELRPSSTSCKLGSSSYKWGSIYVTNVKATTVEATKLVGSWYDGTGSSAAYLDWTTVSQSGTHPTIAPAVNNSYFLGHSTKKWATVYSTNFIGDLHGAWVKPDATSYKLEWAGGTSTYRIAPSSTNKIDLGSSSYQFQNVYAKQFYQNGTAISTSDERKKKNIKDIGQKYLDFFKKLKPRSFKFKKPISDSGRTHTGFIAQEVEAAAKECGIESTDLAFLCKDKEGNYGLRYEELIAIQTKVIQDLMERVERLEKEAK